MALLLAQALDSKKGKDIRVLETDSVTTLADYFVLCTGTSAPQLKALADAGESHEGGGHPPPITWRGTGEEPGFCRTTATWWSTCLTREARAFYDLDRLWEDAKVVDLSQVLQPGGERGGDPFRWGGPSPPRRSGARLYPMDVVARKRRMDGYNVLFPMGYDAFGLPTENYAIKNHIHPAKVTHDNIANFTKPAEDAGLLL